MQVVEKESQCRVSQELVEMILVMETANGCWSWWIIVDIVQSRMLWKMLMASEVAKDLSCGHDKYVGLLMVL